MTVESSLYSVEIELSTGTMIVFEVDVAQKNDFFDALRTKEFVYLEGKLGISYINPAHVTQVFVKEVGEKQWN